MSTNLYANKSVQDAIVQFMDGLGQRNPHQNEFHQAVQEVVESVMPFYLEHKAYRDGQILERLTEPDRIVSFRVPWEDDQGNLRANRAWRVQFNHALGPYKGGLRFHKTVNESVLKFLGFEQVFKNALTKLPLGGGKGGSNFNPKGKSEREIMRFCQSLMTELHRHIGPDVDVPAGDIGVGSREVGYMFGQYLRLQNRWHGVLTGKGTLQGGSLIRTEATGYGTVYFVEEMMQHRGESLQDKTVIISGAGNVAIYAAEQCLKKGAKVLSLSDSKGTLHIPDGLTEEQLEALKELKFQTRGPLGNFCNTYPKTSFHEGEKPWKIEADVALPCATQNEILKDDALDLVKNKITCVAEGANMPADAEAAQVFHEHDILHAPGKASNAGGVAVSGLEMSQNAMRLSWSAEKVDSELATIMRSIHKECIQHAQEDASKEKPYVNYVRGANVASFRRVADVMLSYGVY